MIPRKLVLALLSLLSVLGLVLTASPAQALNYTEATNAGNSQATAYVRGPQGTFGINPGYKIGGDILSWWTPVGWCTSMNDQDTGVTTNVSMKYAPPGPGDWHGFPYQGHHYYIFLWNC